MRFIVLTFLVFPCLFACQSGETIVPPVDSSGRSINTQLLEDTTGFTTIKWIDSLKNIGLVPAGKKAEISFRFRNTGEKPLFIVAAEPGCGCTVTDFPQEAIAPGKEGIISASYDIKADAHGEFRKNIHVKTNTKDKTDTYIFFFGKVKSEGDTTNIETAKPIPVRTTP